MQLLGQLLADHRHRTSFDCALDVGVAIGCRTHNGKEHRPCLDTTRIECQRTHLSHLRANYATRNIGDYIFNLFHYLSILLLFKY